MWCKAILFPVKFSYLDIDHPSFITLLLNRAQAVPTRTSHLTIFHGRLAIIIVTQCIYAYAHTHLRIHNVYHYIHSRLHDHPLLHYFVLLLYVTMCWLQ